MKKMRGFTLIELLIVVAIIAILAAIAVPNFLEAQVRAKVSRVRTDQRSMATAIEAYYVDNNIYPAWDVGTGPGGTQTYNFAVVQRVSGTGNRGAGRLECFLMNGMGNNQRFMTLTTPIAYITSYTADPFATTKGCTFSYASVFPGDRMTPTGKGGVGWILWSFGPDVDEFKNPNSPSDSPWYVYNPARSQPSSWEVGIPGGLLAGDSGDGQDNGQDAFTYDPTNGTVSGGDVWRVKQ